MRKAIVIGIILSIAVLIAVVVYLFNTKREGFQASDPFKARMDEIKGSDLSTLPYDTLTDGGVYMIAGKVKTEVSRNVYEWIWKLYTSKEANRTRGYFTSNKNDANIFILKYGTRGASGRCAGYQVHDKDNSYLSQVTKENYNFKFVTSGNSGLFVDSYCCNKSIWKNDYDRRLSESKSKHKIY